MKRQTILFILAEIAKEMQKADIDRQLYLMERRSINLKRLSEMERDEIKEKLIVLIINVSGLTKDVISEDSKFRGDLCFDSLDDIELIMDAEDEFNIQIFDDEAENVVTVKDAIDLIFKTIK